MKKGLFGYSTSEVNIALDALREENESLNATIITLKTQLKNNLDGNSAKSNLLEANLKQKEEELLSAKEELEDMKLALENTNKELENIKTFMDLKSQAEDLLHGEKESLKAQLEAAYTSEYHADTIALREKTSELKKAQKKIQQLKNELAIARSGEKKQGLFPVIKKRTKKNSCRSKFPIGK